MKINFLTPLFLLLTLVMTGCSKTEEAEPVKEEIKPSTEAVGVFHKPDSYYQMYVYRYDSTTTKWTNRIASHFSTIPTDDPSFIGFTNPYVVGSGVNLFGMVTLYQEAIGSNNIKEAKINAEKVLQFFPEKAGATKGTVKIPAQNITITRKEGSPFAIGISGEGTYDATLKVMDLVVKFNETSIGGKAAVFRKYKLSVDPQSLN